MSLTDSVQVSHFLTFDSLIARSGSKICSTFSNPSTQSAQALCSASTQKPSFARFFHVRREGFEPPEPIGRWIYSPLQLTTLPPAHLIYNKSTYYIVDFYLYLVNTIFEVPSPLVQSIYCFSSSCLLQIRN